MINECQKVLKKMLSSSLPCGKWQSSFSIQTENFNVLIPFLSIFEIIFWNQHRKKIIGRMKQQEMKRCIRVTFQMSL